MIDRLGDRCGVVAHPFQLVRHVVQGEEVAQVARDRLLGRDRDRDQTRDPSLGLVDDRVALDHVQRERRIVRDQGPGRLADRRFDEGAHPENGVADQLLFAVQRFAWSRATGARQVRMRVGVAESLISASIWASIIVSPVGRSSVIVGLGSTEPAGDVVLGQLLRSGW